MERQRKVLITGTSTGIGHAAAELFAEKGWNVLAGSRNPNALKFTHGLIESIEVDVNSVASIDRCFADPRVKDIDCVVNNAGYGLLFPFEDTPPEEIEKLFRTNVFGLMEVTRRSAKIFREKRAGTIINISSVVGRIGIPFYNVYCSTKFAVEGFSEALSHELRPFNVHVKIVEPGGTRTEFHRIAYDTDQFSVSNAYQKRLAAKRASHFRGAGSDDPAEKVASVIVQAATDGRWKLRYPLAQAARTALGRRLLGDEGLWQRLCRKFGSV